MFISNDEAEKRVESSRRLLGTDLHVTLPVNPVSAPVIDNKDASDLLDPTVLDVIEEAAEGDGVTAEKLDRLLNPSSGRPYRVRSKEEMGAIAVSGILLGSARQAAELHGVNAHSAADYQGGFTSSSNGPHAHVDGTTPNKQLQQIIKDNQTEIVNIAQRKLKKVLNLMTDEKLAAVAKVTDLSKIARDMSMVVEKATPKEVGSGNHAHFHIYRPELKGEDHYEVVETSGPIASSAIDAEIAS